MMIKRYKISTKSTRVTTDCIYGDYSSGRNRFKVHRDGEWVKYEDVEKLLERIKVLEKGQVDV